MNKKNKQLTLLLLCIAFGLLGVHRFYRGKYITGIFMLLTLGGIGAWYLVDLVTILMGKFPDKKKKERTKVAYL